MKHSIQGVILAAGKSTRVNTGRSKLLEPLCGQEMILYPTKALDSLDIPITLVVGHHADAIKNCVERHHSGAEFVPQEEQRGTGHALLCTMRSWSADNILVLNGDMPLVPTDVLEQLIEKHTASKSDITFVSAHNVDPSLTGYGRIMKFNNRIAIVEAKDFEGNTHEHCCVNAGIYLFSRAFLNTYLPTLQPNGKTGEYYITDLIGIASANDCRVETVSADFDRIRGINTLKELWAAEQIKRSDLISFWMEQGVRFYSAQSVHIDINVSIGQGSYIGCGAHLINGTKIGLNTTIEAFCIVSNCTIGNNVTINSHSVLHDSTIEDSAHVGPFAHVRTESTIKHNATVGNFVEIKKSLLGAHTKAKHLSYIGDAQVGERVNIGAGTITCNHNGTTKNRTVINDNAYIGSNTIMIAPVTIGEHAFTAAGSVITQSVPAESLAIARSRQIIKDGYAQKIKEKNAQKSSNDTDQIDTNEKLSFVGALKTYNNSVTENS
jgi:bifunctional UDP-N-acetylglucosamine pyrophosphorylase/glucosamine-1-phosphate N-acetyltransferase